MSIMPPDSCAVSDAGSGVSSGVHLFAFLILVLAADHHSIAGVEPAVNLRELRSLQTHRDVANVNAIAVVEHVDRLLLPVQHQRLHRNRHDILHVPQLQQRVGIHSRSNGEVLVLHVDFGLHGAGFEVHIARKAHDLAGERAADRIDANLQLVADVNILHIVLGHRHAQPEQTALRERTMGRAWSLELVPPWISAPVSA